MSSQSKLLWIYFHKDYKLHTLEKAAQLYICEYFKIIKDTMIKWNVANDKWTNHHSNLWDVSLPNGLISR